MNELAPSDRPREKLRRHGAAALGDNELVALVIGSSSGRGGALAVANTLLAQRGGLHGLMRSTSEELADVHGIGPARAAQIAAALELGRRTLAHAPGARIRVGAPREAAAHLIPLYGSRDVEHFGVLLLDSRHRLMRTVIVAVGGLNAASVEPRDVFRDAVLGRAAAVVVFHNHPSGDPTPSTADVELTRRLAAAGELIGIDVVDHLIVGDVRYCSLKEMGAL